MTPDEQRQFGRLEHHNAGLQQTVSDLQDKLVEANKAIELSQTRNQELRGTVKELLSK